MSEQTPEWVVAQRRELVGFLEGLSTEQWNAPTLCEGWRVPRSDRAHHHALPILGAAIRRGNGQVTRKLQQDVEPASARRCVGSR